MKFSNTIGGVWRNADRYRVAPPGYYLYIITFKNIHKQSMFAWIIVKTSITHHHRFLIGKYVTIYK